MTLVECRTRARWVPTPRTLAVWSEFWAIMGWSEWRQCTDKWQLGKRRQPPGNSSDCSLGAAHHPHYPRCPFYQGTSTASEVMLLVILMILITSSMLVMELPQPPIKRQSSKLLTPLIQPILGLSRTWKVKFLVNLQPSPAFVRTLSYQKTEFSGGLPYYELGHVLGNLEAVFLWSSHCLKTTKFCPRTLWHIALETRLFRGHIISTKIFHIPKK